MSSPNSTLHHHNRSCSSSPHNYQNVDFGANRTPEHSNGAPPPLLPPRCSITTSAGSHHYTASATTAPHHLPPLTPASPSVPRAGIHQKTSILKGSCSDGSSPCPSASVNSSTERCSASPLRVNFNRALECSPQRYSPARCYYSPAKDIRGCSPHQTGYTPATSRRFSPSRISRLPMSPLVSCRYHKRSSSDDSRNLHAGDLDTSSSAMPEPLSNHHGHHYQEDEEEYPACCDHGACCGEGVPLTTTSRHLCSFPIQSSPLTPHRPPRRHDRRQSSSPARNTSSSDHDSGSSTRPRSRQRDLRTHVHEVRRHIDDGRGHSHDCDHHQHDGADQDDARQSLADDEGISSSSSSSDDDAGDREGSSGRRGRHHVSRGRQVNGRTAHRGSPSIVDDSDWPPPSPLLNSLLEGHFTRLSTPPNSRRLSTPPHRPPPGPSKTRLHDYGAGNPCSTSGHSITPCRAGFDLESAGGRTSRKVDTAKREGSVGRCNTHPGRDRSQERSRRDGSVERFCSSGNYCCRYSNSNFSNGCGLNHSNSDARDCAPPFMCDSSRYAGGGSHHRHSYHEGVVSSGGASADGGRRSMRSDSRERCLPAEDCTCSRCTLASSGLLPSTCGGRNPMLALTCSGNNHCLGPAPHFLGRCSGPKDVLYSRGDPDGRRCDQKERYSSGGGRMPFELKDGNEEEETGRDGDGCRGCQRGRHQVGCDGWQDPDEDPLLPDYIPLWRCHNDRVSAADTRARSLQQQQHSSLEMQVSVLTEQVEAQAEKIQDLESQLHAKNRLLVETEEKLHKEVMAVSGLETQRLQLLSELSTLQLRQASSQHGARLPHLQLSPLLAEFTAGSPGSISTLSTIPPSNALQLYDNNANNTSTASAIGADTNKNSAPRTPPPSFNRQVDPLLQSLRTTRSASTSTRPSPSSTHHTLNGDGAPVNGSGTSSTLGPATTKTLFGGGGKGGYSSTCEASFPPFAVSGKRSSSAPNLAETEKQGEVPPDRLPHSPSLTRDDRSRSIQHPLASEDRQNYGPADGQPGTAPSYNNYGHPSPSISAGGNSRKSPTSLKTLSSGNLHNIHNLQQYSSEQPAVTSPITTHKPTTIKKIFTRLRRSSSGHLRGSEGATDKTGSRGAEEQQQLRRGGVRATATARLGWAPHSPSWTEPKVPFLTWTTADCERWLESLGLAQYGAALRCWQGSSGNHLSRATPSQLDKQLGVRHPLHRKKLQLAISARMGVEGSLGRESPGNQIESAALSSVWVSQWLDDVGLPQYKEAFHEARVDPRVLDVLTWDDLAFLKINSLLHAISLKRGVQVLREHNFDSSSLIRRSATTPASPSDKNDNNNRGLNGNSCPSDAEDACLWTNHRVMEWLRTVDLSEYAPNLRGSGVHGALLVYEVRFNAEVLAALLSIPSSKTLLRRHLNTHFKELVGREVVLEKRQVEDTPGYTALTTATKIKPNKRSQFSLKRRSSSKSRGGHTLEFDDLLCPLEERPPRAAVERRALENSPETRLC